MGKPEKKYIALHKPYGFLSQFTDADGHAGLNQLNLKIPKNVYPLGRLDRDSEGLLLLTNNKSVNKALMDPAAVKTKTYWAQVSGLISLPDVVKLENGVTIKLKSGEYTTLPCSVSIIDQPSIEERHPPVRESITSWIELRITEGKNRQVRKMCAAVGYPCLRLIRVGIEGIELGNLSPGKAISFPEKKFIQKLNLALTEK